jgi:hypothetical protein
MRKVKIAPDVEIGITLNDRGEAELSEQVRQVVSRATEDLLRAMESCVGEAAKGGEEFEVMARVAFRVAAVALTERVLLNSSADAAQLYREMAASYNRSLEVVQPTQPPGEA